MRKVLVLGFLFMFLFTGLVAQAQAQVVDPAPAGTFAPFTEGPDIVATDPEAVALGVGLVGFPRWLRDSRGIQLGICTDQVAALAEAPPCAGLELDPVTGAVLEVPYYGASALMCDDPLECDQTPGSVPPAGELYIMEFGVGVAPPDPAAPEPAEGPGMVLRLRPGAGPLAAGAWTIQTPFGTFDNLTADPNSGEIRALPPADPALMMFRGNGTAAIVDTFVPEEVGQAPILAGPFPGFIGNGLTNAPLNGATSNVWRVIGPPGSGIDVQTNLSGVQGKIFSTPESEAGGLASPRATVQVARRNSSGVLFTSSIATPTSVAATGMRVTSVAGAAPAAPITMTADPATGRFFAAFPMGNLGNDPEVGLSVTATDAAGADIPGLVDIPFVMQDTVNVQSATFNAARGGTLAVRATSSVPVARQAAGRRAAQRATGGATLTVESVGSMSPTAPAIANLGTIQGNRFNARNVGATAPQFIRVRSSMGGSMTVPVSVRGQQGATDIVTIQSAIFNQQAGTLVIRARSNVRGNRQNPGPTLTFQSALTPDPTVPGTALTGTPGRRGFTVTGVTVPPAFARVESSLGGFQTVPVQINLGRARR